MTDTPKTAILVLVLGLWTGTATPTPVKSLVPPEVIERKATGAMKRCFVKLTKDLRKDENACENQGCSWRIWGCERDGDEVVQREIQNAASIDWNLKKHCIEAIERLGQEAEIDNVRLDGVVSAMPSSLQGEAKIAYRMFFYRQIYRVASLKECL